VNSHKCIQNLGDTQINVGDLDQSPLKFLALEIIRELPDGLEDDFPFPSDPIEKPKSVSGQRWSFLLKLSDDFLKEHNLFGTQTLNLTKGLLATIYIL